MTEKAMEIPPAAKRQKSRKAQTPISVLEGMVDGARECAGNERVEVSQRALDG